MSTWFSPGRIEVLGKHTDYAGGHSLICAVDRGITVTATPSADGRWHAHSEGLDVVDDLLTTRLRRGHWARYPQTVVGRLLANFGDCAPMTIEVTSDLPPASGMSSSSALVVATALAIAHEAGFADSRAWREQLADPTDLATYLACIENGSSFGTLLGDSGVGTFGGSEDHTAMICSSAGSLGLFTFCPTRLVGRVGFPADLAFVVAVSGVAAEKTGAQQEDYNAASLLVRELQRRWHEFTRRDDASLGAAMRTSEELASQFAAQLDDEALERRLAHFVDESEHLAPSAAVALADGNLERFGELVDRSQAIAEVALRNQVPATASLARSARRLGALAATSFGAGFGGSVWALVPTADAEEFAVRWLAEHRREFPQLVDSSTLVVRPSGPAHPVEASRTPNRS